MFSGMSWEHVSGATRYYPLSPPTVRAEAPGTQLLVMLGLTFLPPKTDLHWRIGWILLPDVHFSIPIPDDHPNFCFTVFVGTPWFPHSERTPGSQRWYIRDRSFRDSCYPASSVCSFLNTTSYMKVQGTSWFILKRVCYCCPRCIKNYFGKFSSIQKTEDRLYLQ